MPHMTANSPKLVDVLALLLSQLTALLQLLPAG